MKTEFNLIGESKRVLDSVNWKGTSHYDSREKIREYYTYFLGLIESEVNLGRTYEIRYKYEVLKSSIAVDIKHPFRVKKNTDEMVYQTIKSLGNWIDIGDSIIEKSKNK